MQVVEETGIVLALSYRVFMFPVCDVWMVFRYGQLFLRGFDLFRRFSVLAPHRACLEGEVSLHLDFLDLALARLFAFVLPHFCGVFNIAFAEIASRSVRDVAVYQVF